MTGRERFLKIAKFEEKGIAWIWDMGMWAETLVRWRKEGMPTDDHLNNIFGFEYRESIPLNLGLLPVFEGETVEETKDYRIRLGSDGVKRKEFIPRTDAETVTPPSMSQWLEFPIKDKKSWEKFKERLNPHSPARYPLNWENLKGMWRDRDYPLFLTGPSFYGWIRNWVGMENLALMFYDNPSLIHEMMNYLAYFYIEVVRKAVQEVEIDCVCCWEDMAYKTASLVSPKMFRDFMLPNYRKVSDFLRGHGIEIILVDSDGNIEELIPLWLEGGVNGVYPLEVAAGMDAVALRKKYGKNLILVGNIDKRALAGQKKDIEEEVNKKVPYLLKEGGYFPGIDHSVPYDISYENYLYCLNLIKSL